MNLKPMTLSSIENLCKTIKHFRGVYLRDTLPDTPLQNEICVLNLDSVENNGTHWTLFYKQNSDCFYFDSFGHRPPIELMNYFKNNVWYSTFILQESGTKYCGHLCVILARILDELNSFPDSVYKLKELLEE